MSGKELRDAAVKAWRETLAEVTPPSLEDIHSGRVQYVKWFGTGQEVHSAARRLLSASRLSEEEISKKLGQDGIDNFFDKYPVTAETRMKQKAYIKGKVDGILEGQERVLGPAEDGEPT